MCDSLRLTYGTSLVHLWKKVKENELPKVADYIPADLPVPAERRRLRMAAGLTLRQLAEIVGTSHSAVSRWETGQREPRGANRRIYAVALDELREVARR